MTDTPTHSSYHWINRRAHPGWAPQPGDSVELRSWGSTTRRGTVEAVMPDQSGFWVAAEGVDERAFVHLEYEDIEIWTPNPPPDLLKTTPEGRTR